MSTERGFFQTGSKKGKIEKRCKIKALAVSFIIAISMIVTGCPKSHEKSGRTTKVTRQKSESGAPKEIIRPEQKEYASVQNPQRVASMQIVNKGRVFIDQKSYDEALQKFQEAITIDSNNGIAYYYLAVARYMLKQYEQAMGVLDKAESLLANSEGWTETIDQLRAQIREESEQNTASEV